MLIRHVYEEDVFLNKKERDSPKDMTKESSIAIIQNRFFSITPIPYLEYKKKPFATIVMPDKNTIGISRCRFDYVYDKLENKLTGKVEKFAVDKPDVFNKKTGIEEAYNNIPTTKAFIEKLYNKKRPTKKDKILIKEIEFMKERAKKYFK